MIKTMAVEMKEHLENKLIPFWESLMDREYGGFYGYVGQDQKVDKKAGKGVILNSRILWFFSNAYLTLRQEDLLGYALHAFEFLRNHCLDGEQGGVYWSVTYDGKPEDTTKHTYNQAFAVYALSTYYEASGNRKALTLALELYERMENSLREGEGYGEAYDRYFKPISNEKLSENGVMAARTMNTFLHVFEAYTKLCQVDRTLKIETRLEEIRAIFANKIYNHEKKRQEVFFDKNWNSLINLHSYGHDIEASWLLARGSGQKMDFMTSILAEEVYKKAYRDHSLYHECELGEDDKDRIWWVQAEAVVGFLNAWIKKPENLNYLEASQDIWGYIKKYMVDSRLGGEWYGRLGDDRIPVQGEPFVDPWKCPYHNGRMCMEVINRLESFVGPTHPFLQYCGRIGKDEEGRPEFVYPSSFVKLDFFGDSIGVLVDNHSAYWNHYLGWILDGEQKKGYLEKDTKTYLTLGEHLGKEKHTLILFKRQDSCHTFSLEGFLLSEGGKIVESKPLPARKIEVYGDSVSAGEVSEAVEYVGKEDPVHQGEYSNSWYSYAWMTARNLNARIHNISQGGIGLMSGTGWFEPPEYMGMESVYDKIQYHPQIGRTCQWDFKKYCPHVVIVALGQNDSNPVDFMKEDYGGSKACLWRAHYEKFVLQLREKYPRAVIILTTTILCHDDSWDRAIDEVYHKLGDENIVHFLYSRNGKGTPGHIRIPEAKEMAEELSGFINGLGEDIWKDGEA